MSNINKISKFLKTQARTTIGEEGLQYSWQKDFPKEVECVHCSGNARIGFVTHEGKMESLSYEDYVCSLHKNDPEGDGYWLHDCCSVAIYFCKKCLEPTAIYNQA